MRIPFLKLKTKLIQNLSITFGNKRLIVVFDVSQLSPPKQVLIITVLRHFLATTSRHIIVRRRDE